MEVGQIQAPGATSVKDEFAAAVASTFNELAGRGMEPNEACALALKVAAGVVDMPPSADELLAAAEAAVEAAASSGTSAFTAAPQHAAACQRLAQLTLAFLENPEAVHAAFWAEEDPCSPSISSPPAASSSSGAGVEVTPGWCVDADALCNLFDRIKASKSSEVDAALAAAADKLLQHLAVTSGRDAPNPGLLRHMAALLLNPAMEEFNAGSNLPARLCHFVVNMLPSAQRQFVQHMLSQWSAVSLGRVVRMLQSFITLTLFSEQNVTRDVENAVRLLSLLNDANDVRSSLPFPEFYNDAVNSEDFNTKEDFRRWKSGPPRYGFSFCQFPFIYDPAAKAQILRWENNMQQFQEFESSMLQALMSGTLGDACPYLVLRVRRGPHLLSDTLQQINRAKQSNTLKKPLKVKFVGEEGVDEGGVQKEFFQLLIRDAFRPDYGMFSFNEATRLYWFRSSQLPMQDEFELIGILIGLAIYNSHILEFSFPMVLYKKLKGCDQYTLDDLAELQPDVAASLRKLLAMDAAQLAALDLAFQVEVDTGFGEMTSVDLIPNGSATPVTPANAQQYVDAYVRHLLEGSIAEQFGAFRCGFLRLCSGAALQFFRPAELEQLVCGGRQLDLEALQAHTVYEDGFTAASPVITWFWEVVHGLDEERKRRLLFFITGSDRVPIKGLAHLSPAFVISRNGPHSERLPTAHTCFNHLLLPQYKDRETLERLLLTAIDAGCEGFGLV